jgi:hypothetical protein
MGSGRDVGLWVVLATAISVAAAWCGARPSLDYSTGVAAFSVGER